MKALNKEGQAKISPQDSIDLLLAGNQRFMSNTPVDRDLHDQISDTATGQYPFSSILSCIDSRIPTEVVFDQGIGDLFNARIAGNFINEDILGSLEFACKLAGSKSILVMGHTSCGAVKGACDDAKLGNLSQMLDKIKPAVDMTESTPSEARNSSNLDFVNKVAVNNVLLAINKIREESPVLKEMEDNGEIIIAGGMYDVKTGRVSLV